MWVSPASRASVFAMRSTNGSSAGAAVGVGSGRWYTTTQLNKTRSQPSASPSRCYSTASDNTRKYKIVDSTLREGEQFASCKFTTTDRIYIAKTLDRIGVDYIELVNPAASTQAAFDCQTIANMGLEAKVLTHTRCHMHDVTKAIECGVDGVNLYMATSSVLSQHSHGKGIDAVIEIAAEVIEFVKSHGVEVRFSCEDSFRSDPSDLLKIYKAVDDLGVDRVGIADTVGVATPLQVYETTQMVREVLRPETGIEFHTHDDTGCCIANALMAIEGGATHIDTCVLGIGERNGITPLSGFLGRMYTLNKEDTIERYDLKLLQHIERYVAQAVDVKIPFNNCVTGSVAFSHKAGVHSKAVVADPSTYEVINPDDFGVERMIQFAHRLTGWNAMSHRAKVLGLDVSDDQVRAATSMIKDLADVQDIRLDHVDEILIALGREKTPASSSQLRVMAENAPPELQAALKDAVSAVEQFEQSAAASAVASVNFDTQADDRMSTTIKVQGHLFDESILNKMLDVAVDSPCEFEVSNLDVPRVNEEPSTALIKLEADSNADLEFTMLAIKTVIDQSSNPQEFSFEVVHSSEPMV